jgi:hypothetical protein
MGRLTWRLALLTIVFVALAIVLFGPQLERFRLSFQAITIAVRNATSAEVVVSTVESGGARSFYVVGPAQTRLIPGTGGDELITILDAGCHILDARTRGHPPPAFLLAEVTDAGTTWREAAVPAGLDPANAAAEPCAVQP